MNLDLIFSIGPACRPAYHLKQNFLRLFACPLDWQMNYSLDTCLNLFQTSFKTFFSEIYVNTDRLGARNNLYVIDTQNTITSIHHFSSTLPLAEAQKSFRAMMQKRFYHLNETILHSKSVGLICNRNDSLQELSTFLLSFGELYPNQNFVLINIRHTDNLESIYSQEYTLNSRLTIREYLCNDIYQNPEKYNSNYWLGNIDCWNQILSEYCLTTHPFIQQLKYSSAANKSIILYGAGSFCYKILNFVQKYNIPISGIAVTSTEGNPSTINGIPVVPIDTYTENKMDSTIVITIWDPVQSELVYKQLSSLGFTTIFRINSSFEFF